jgi:hypothetical protein
LRILVKFSGGVDELKDAGLTVGSVAGDIATGSIRLSDLPAIASAPNVVFIELAQPLAPG